MICGTSRERVIKALMSFSFCLLIVGKLVAQTNACPTCWVPILKQKMVTGLNISPQIKGYVEYLPPGYSSSSKRYALILFVHGVGSVGPGTAESLCYVACGALPLKIEEGKFSDVVFHNGQSYSFIVLSPQFANSNAAPSDITAMIDYAISRYRVDINRVYLTGLSSGSDVIMNYMSSSAAAANRIAAINPLAVCSPQNTNGSTNIGSQGIHFWGLHCGEDNTCNSGNTVSWANGINLHSPQGNPMAKYTLTPVYNQSFNHDIWYVVYDSAYKENGRSIYQWMIQYSRNFAQTGLPIKMETYTARLDQDKHAVIEWTTSMEENTDYFTIEYSSDGLRFKEIGRVKAAGNSSTRNSYQLKDPSVLKGTGFYRLVLMNLDGEKEIFETRKLVSRVQGFNMVLKPIPAGNQLQVSFDLTVAQKLQFTIRDINGRTMESWSANFSSGAALLPIRIDKLAGGIYYLSVQGTEFTEIKKFVKQ